MSDFQQGPGWWYASDGKWYPPPPTQPAYQQAPLWRQPDPRPPRMPRQPVPTERIVRGALIGWAVGTLIAFALAAVIAAWLVSGMDG